jgi:hypothetical protein
MPYNPSSAYPRHSTYTPPVYNRGYARGFNEVDWAQRFGHPSQMPGVDVGHAISRVANAPRNVSASDVSEMVGRKGVLSIAAQSAKHRAQQLRNVQLGRKVWNRAEYGDDPNESAAAEPEMTAFQAARGGREHVGGINDRLQDFERRETMTTGVEQAAAQILTGKSGGPKTVPKLVFASARGRR